MTCDPSVWRGVPNSYQHANLGAVQQASFLASSYVTVRISSDIAQCLSFSFGRGWGIVFKGFHPTCRMRAKPRRRWADPPVRTEPNMREGRTGFGRHHVRSSPRSAAPVQTVDGSDPLASSLRILCRCHLANSSRTSWLSVFSALLQGPIVFANADRTTA